MDKNARQFAHSQVFLWQRHNLRISSIGNYLRLTSMSGRKNGFKRNFNVWQFVTCNLHWIALKTARVNAIESIALDDNKMMLRLVCKIKENFNFKSAQTQFIINCRWSRTEFLTNRHRTKIITTAFNFVNSLVTRNKYLKRRIWVLFWIEMLIEIYYLSESWQKNPIWMGFLKMFCIKSAYFQSEADNNND